MALALENLSTVDSNMLLPTRGTYRRRPKLIPPKVKCFTRARINLNNVWSLVDETSSPFDQQRSPLQSSNRFNINSQLPYPTQRSQRGNEFHNHRLNSAELSSNPCSTITNSSTSNQVDKQCDSVFLRKALFLKSTSAPNLRHTPGLEVNGTLNPQFPSPIVSLDDLAVVLGEYERRDRAAAGRIPTASCDIQNQAAFVYGRGQLSSVNRETEARKRVLQGSPLKNHNGNRQLCTENEEENYADDQGRRLGRELASMSLHKKTSTKNRLFS